MKRMKKILILILAAMTALRLCACSAGSEEQIEKDAAAVSLELKYARQFTVDCYDEGYRHIHIADGTDYVCVPEGAPKTDLGYEDAVIIQLPVKEIYLAASSAMDLFVRMDGLDSIGSCSTTAGDYTVEEAKERIESGEIRYVGKYSAPDYETIIESGCNLAIESTMITHSPETKEELERLGLPVLVERSSYEKDPLGRLEWIKLYGVLLGKEEEACSFLDTEEEKLRTVTEGLEIKDEKERPSVAFFYVSANGYVNIRKPGDYISTMIEMAGGRYCPGDIDTGDANALSTMNINWEQFYVEASQADILIYNSTIDGGLKTLKDLEDKNSLFEDFKAVKTGRVYCSETDVFQKSSAVCDVILDLYRVINRTDEDKLGYLFELE